MADDGPTAADERRRYPRVPIAWPVKVVMDEVALVGETADVSAFGICVVTAPTAALKVGRSCRVDVLADKAVRFTFDGEIRYVGEQAIGLETRQPLHRAGWFS